jgi:hypothetical protein
MGKLRLLEMMLIVVLPLGKDTKTKANLDILRQAGVSG